MVYDWDPTLPPRGIAFNLRGQTVAGPPSMTGQSQVSSYDAGYWVADYSRVPVGAKARINAYRALIAKLEGGAHQVRVPVYDLPQAPWPLSGGLPVTSVAATEFTDGTRFTDGTGFFESSILIALSAAAALRATNIAAPTVTTSGTVSAGMYFSIGDRLYRIKEILDDGSWSITPPLREAAASGAELNFDNPVCRMRLVSEGSGDLALDRAYIGFPDLSFVEVF